LIVLLYRQKKQEGRLDIQTHKTRTAALSRPGTYDVCLPAKITLYK